jgi:hypothetical protein
MDFLYNTCAQMLGHKPAGFFAYPSHPSSSGETIRRAIELINAQNIVSLHSWEECNVGGKLIVHEICKAIDGSQLFCADITGMNANVMFELGYAIAREKRIWLLLEPTYVDSKAEFEQLRVLTTVGYAKYSNSNEIVSRFNHEHPYSDLENTLFDQAIRRSLPLSVSGSVLYLKSLYENEAGIRISSSVAALSKEDIDVIVDDPKESGAQSLTWYGTQVYSAAAVICHFTGTTRVGHRLHNARHALVAGLALGMERRLLMLAEGDFLAPIDYRDLLLQYQSAADAARHLGEWKLALESDLREKRQARRQHAVHERLATELKGLQIGEYVAENEAGRLVDEYFVDTSAYLEALNGNELIFVGRKGCGKTANLLKLASELGKDKRNLVCVIKPVAYELQSVLNLFSKYKEQDEKGYVIETLWKFLILTELANAAAASITEAGAGPPSASESALLDLMEREHGKLKGEFAVRLERCVGELVRSHSPHAGVEATRLGISETLHQREIRDLRIILGDLLSSKGRVAILVDNLDKPWDRRSDLGILSEFLLGLLSAADRLTADFRRSDSRRLSVNISLAIFLRADIFHRLMTAAREPDKIRYSRLRWGDREMLMRVIEERFVASHEGAVNPGDIWSKYFCEKVRGLPPREYFASRILLRPRDLVFFVKTAMAMAVNRNHDRVTEQDILDSEKQYSQFAFDSVLVEDGTSAEPMEDVLYEFVGSQTILTRDEIVSRLSKIEVSDVGRVIELLCTISFLGMETRRDRFRFLEDPQEYRKVAALAERVSRDRRKSPRYKIHSAFTAFLELTGN